LGSLLKTVSISHIFFFHLKSSNHFCTPQDITVLTITALIIVVNIHIVNPLVQTAY